MTEKLDFFRWMRGEGNRQPQNGRKGSARGGNGMRQAAQYFAESTRVLCGKYSFALRTTFRGFPRAAVRKSACAACFLMAVLSGCQSFFFILVFVHVEVEQEVVQVFRRGEFVQAAALLLGGASGAFGAVDETADAVHLQQLVLLRRRHVFEDFGNQFGAHPLLDGLFDLERIGDRRLAHVDDVARLDGARRLQLCPVHGNLAFLACGRGHGAGLEDAGGP